MQNLRVLETCESLNRCRGRKIGEGASVGPSDLLSLFICILILGVSQSAGQNASAETMNHTENGLIPHAIYFMRCIVFSITG